MGRIRLRKKDRKKAGGASYVMGKAKKRWQEKAKKKKEDK